MRRTSSNRVHQRTNVHHRRGGGGEAGTCCAAESDDFCLSLAISQPLSALLGQVHTYQRLTPFTVLDQAVESLANLRPGDCIVCFSKNDIYSISRQIEARGLECAVIYGSLPPGECAHPSRLSTFALRQL